MRGERYCCIGEVCMGSHGGDLGGVLDDDIGVSMVLC